MKTIRVVVSGKVQGVGYRHFIEDAARRLALDGWVRNRLDGTVELLALGEAMVLEELIAACRQGPAAGRVDQVDITEESEVPIAGFHRRPTF